MGPQELLMVVGGHEDEDEDKDGSVLVLCLLSTQRPVLTVTPLTLKVPTLPTDQSREFMMHHNLR